MNDAEVDARDSSRVQVVPLDRDGGGNGKPQPASIVQQSNCAHLLGRVAERTRQPYPEFRPTFRHRNSNSLAFHLEGAVVEANRDE
jgi:hypothetical protein